jgi:hypothetical protein
LFGQLAFNDAARQKKGGSTFVNSTFCDITIEIAYELKELIEIILSLGSNVGPLSQALELARKMLIMVDTPTVVGQRRFGPDASIQRSRQSKPFNRRQFA